MFNRHQYLVLEMSILLFIPSAFAWGQIGVGGGFCGQGGFGRSRGNGGVQGLSEPRGGLGFRSNPIANPAPSLTPHEVFNPRGSLSVGHVLNPAPSLQRPRSGGTVPTSYQQPGAATGSVSRPVQPSDSIRTRKPEVSTPVGQQLQRSASTLERQLTQVAPGKGWEEYLSVETLHKIEDSGAQPSDVERPVLQALLARYESVAADAKYKIISSLPEFQQTVGALQLYLKPMDERRRLELSLHFDQLGDQLREYKNGASWAKYLALPKELLSDETAKETTEPTRKLLKRFDRLSSDATYAKVTALPAFRPAYEALKRAVDPTDMLASPAAAPREQPIAAGDQQPVAVDEGPRSAGPSAGDSPEPRSSDSETPRGERILESVVELDRQLGKAVPNSEWPKRLSLDELRGTVSVFSEQPANDSERISVQDILATYQEVAKNKDNAVVNELPEFKETLEALQEYLKPRDARPEEK